ncbi:MAG: bifunctional adenosylcobinamide kinase/adenosylcobinamide-phosphate guanylyltransferase [Eubacteriales bacterium]|nr:bifunctional adenosylcobinamide kinase/adenosylcobinamide-phosphate guanylyltransferase [Eubacteriales bacterium]
MILIVGGNSQGKAAYARELAAKEYKESGVEIPIVDGMTDSWEDAGKGGCLLNFHGFVRQVMDAKADPDRFTEALCQVETEKSRQPEIVTMDEVGCGIVPLDKRERDYREAVGRAGQILAAHADTVYRMICGVPVQIK